MGPRRAYVNMRAGWADSTEAVRYLMSHCVDTVVTSTAVSIAQPVRFIQLTAEEADRLRGMPIGLDLDSGFFVFPPMPDRGLPLTTLFFQVSILHKLAIQREPD